LFLFSVVSSRKRERERERESGGGGSLSKIREGGREEKEQDRVQGAFMIIRFLPTKIQIQKNFCSSFFFSVSKC